MKIDINSQIQFKPTTPLLFLALVLGCFAFSRAAEAALDPTDTPYGTGALSNENGGFANSAFGYHALLNNTTGLQNTAAGTVALYSNESGSNNTASGSGAIYYNKASDNTATGYQALIQNTTGNQNTAIGSQALLGTFGSTASFNTATGFQTLFSTTSGGGNVANGWQALYANESGGFNTALGVSALKENTVGNQNTATGVNALYHNNGPNNTATGFQALQNNTAGSSNIALGYQAGFNLTIGSNNIDIGNPGAAGDAKKIRIGTKGTHTATFIAGISGKTVASGVGVIINSNGQLGTVQSSGRFKEGVKPMDKASEAILELEPVTFRYKHELDPDGIPQFGLVAEQVEKVNPDLVARDEEGKAYTVRYEAVNAMLLNEFLKEHRKIEQLEATVTQLKKEMETAVARLKEQDSKIQGVSGQLELSKPTPRMAVNDQ